MSTPRKIHRLAAVVAVLACASAAFAGPQDEPKDSLRKRSSMIWAAHEFAEEEWVATQANMTADCAPGYRSTKSVGANTGLPYDWGGFMDLPEFRAGIADGLGAGSHSGDGILECTVGHDCSGFVGSCWNVSAANRFATSSMGSVTVPIADGTTEMLPGDAFNKAGSHTVLFYNYNDDGTPAVYESAGGADRVWFNATGYTWSKLSAYVPVRYPNTADDCRTGPECDALITGGSGGGAEESPDPFLEPTVVDSIPYDASFDMAKSKFKKYEAYGDCTVDEGAYYGPEMVFEVTVPAAGTLTAEITPTGSGFDPDVFILDGNDLSICFASGDTYMEGEVEGGNTYYIVVDSWGADAASAKPGKFDIHIDFFTAGEEPTGPAGDDDDDETADDDEAAPAGDGGPDDPASLVCETDDHCANKCLEADPTPACVAGECQNCELVAADDAAADEGCACSSAAGRWNWTVFAGLYVLGLLVRLTRRRRND